MLSFKISYAGGDEVEGLHFFINMGRVDYYSIVIQDIACGNEVGLQLSGIIYLFIYISHFSFVS